MRDDLIVDRHADPIGEASATFSLCRRYRYALSTESSATVGSRRVERVAQWLHHWDRLHADATPWAELDDANRAPFYDGARELLATIGVDADGVSYAAHVEGSLAAVLAELTTLKTELRQVERDRDMLQASHRDRIMLHASHEAALAARDRLRGQLDAIYWLHTDSPAGVCPSCGRIGDVSDVDDGLVDWPCPTLRAMGVEDLGPSDVVELRIARPGHDDGNGNGVLVRTYPWGIADETGEGDG